MKCLLCNKEINFRLTIKDICWPGIIEQRPICTSCTQQFVKYNRQNRCPGCYKDSNGLCAECQCWHQRYGWHLKHRALYRYNEAMKKFMHQYKFMGDYRLRRVFQYEFSQQINLVGADIIVPIPVSRETMQTRGFNQVTGLLREVGYLELLQTKKKSKQAQSSKNRRERLATPQPFMMKNESDIKAKKVLLIDDVYTTGRTLYHAAALFKQAGCGCVVSASLAR